MKYAKMNHQEKVENAVAELNKGIMVYLAPLYETFTMDKVVHYTIVGREMVCCLKDGRTLYVPLNDTDDAYLK